jgi:hypothetical protein
MTPDLPGMRTNMAALIVFGSTATTSRYGFPTLLSEKMPEKVISVISKKHKFAFTQMVYIIGRGLEI